jgi:hypothetical protein
MTELMLAVALSVYATTLFCIWAGSLVMQRASAQKKIAVIATTSSLADQLRADEQLAQKTTMSKEDVIYRWQIKSYPLNQLDYQLGKADVQRYFKIIKITATWYDGRENKHYELKRALA